MNNVDGRTLSGWQRVAAVLVVLLLGMVNATRAAAPRAGATSATSAASADSSITSSPPSARKREAANDTGFRIAPIPAWVSPLTPELSVSLPPAPVHVLLIDDQTRLEPGTVTRFTHSLRQVNDSTGLAVASQLQIEFDPSYQSLVLHRIEVQRGAQRISKLDRRSVRLLRREPRLERQMIDGRVTATVQIDDLRVGDRIDWAYSLVGDNPVFAGRFVENAWMLSSAGPAASVRWRLLAPVERKLRYQAPAMVTASEHMVAEGRETLFVRRSAPAFRFDPTAPASVFLDDVVQVSEFADWADVARWADGLFGPAVRPGPEVAARAAAIRAQSNVPEEQLRLALDAVQNEVRYFATEIGADSHRPAPADQVWTQRFGDCKDKVAALTALLGALDIPAMPALASVRYRGVVADMLPSPLAFDHAIAAVRLGDGLLWLDGTRALQSGPARERQSVGLGRGLLASAGVTALSELPGTTDELRVVSTDLFEVGDFASPVQLTSQHVYYGELAEYVRGSHAELPAPEFARQFGADYLRLYPAARAEGPPTLESATDRNSVTLTWHYTLPDAWRFPEQRTLAADFALPTLAEPLRLPDQSPRTQAFRVAYPGIYRHSVSFRFAEDVFAKPSSSRFDDSNGFFELHLRSDGDARQQTIDGEMRLLADTIPAADWGRYREQLNKAWPRLASTLNVSAITLARLDRLKTDIQALDQDIRRGRTRVVTPAQADMRARLLALTAQLDSGRLSPKLRAEALVARGSQLDHLGLTADARADFEAALGLADSSAEAHAALAVNALLRGEDGEARHHADIALKLSPADIAPRYTRAYANYFGGQFVIARDELAEILTSRSEVERSYGAIWLYLAARRAGGDGPAGVAKLLPSGRQPAWPYPVLQLMLGNSNLDHALQAANETGRPDPGRLCELYFYAGQKALLDGDLPQARRHLQSSVDTGVVEFTEHALALRELQRLRAP